MRRLGFLADDLTGAADVLAQAHAHGLEAALSLNPTAALPDARDVVGIAGPTRSLAGRDLDHALREGFTGLTPESFDVLLYKVCSTFDSSPTTGSIGKAIDILGEMWPNHGGIPVVPAQPEFGRFTAFSQHFGTHQGAVHRLDRHPVMRSHPSTPMDEADLRLVLASQLAAGERPGSIHLPAFDDGSFCEQWQARRKDYAPFIVDAITAAHMDTVAKALLGETDMSIVIGSGGIMAALARSRGTSSAVRHHVSPSSGPTLAVSASASETTAVQIADAIAAGWTEVAIPPEALTQEAPQGQWVDEIAQALESGHHVITHTARGGTDPRLQARTATSAEVGGTIGALAAMMIQRGLTQDLAIFGGDSSSHALLALEVSELRVDSQFVTAGPICRADSASIAASCRLLLKGGQVGPENILRRFTGGEEAES